MDRRLRLDCPICSKPLELVEEITINSEILKSYKCGHVFTDDVLVKHSDKDLNFKAELNGFEAREYQKEGIRFVLDSDFCCVLAHQMRLGKTPMSLLAVKNHPKFKDDDFTVLILARAANIWQWKREVNTWVDTKPDAVWICQGTKNWIPKGFKFYIMSMDTFGRKGVSDSLLEFGFKVVIADEAHSFKNTDSQRSQALIAFLKNIERSTLEKTLDFSCPFCTNSKWQETITIQVSSLEGEKRTSKQSHCPKCFAVVAQSAATHIKVKRNCGIVMLTGTPIKNRADEYFVPLNIIIPDKIPSIERFRRKWLIQDSKGKWTRVSPLAFDSFKQMIEPYVLRREKEDVYTDLPKLNRIFTPIEISDQRLIRAYNQVLDVMELEQAAKPNLTWFESIGHFQQLRQIAGLAKVNWVADYAETFLMDSEKQKLAIGVHHHSVRDAMKLQLGHIGVVKLDGEDSPYQKDYMAHKYFPTAPEQILLLGMMAAKEGLELPYIDTILVMEREWCSTDEEQFEYRFYNPDKDYLKARGLENKVTNIEYILAKGTTDEILHDMVEEKKQIVGETANNHWDTSNPIFFKELMQRTLASRLKV